MIATKHPWNLCPECDVRMRTQAAKDAAWERVSLLSKTIYRLLQASAILLGLLCTSFAVWILEPSYYRILKHPWSLAVLVAAGVGFYFSYRLHKDFRSAIEEKSGPVISWYDTESNDGQPWQDPV